MRPDLEQRKEGDRPGRVDAGPVRAADDLEGDAHDERLADEAQHTDAGEISRDDAAPPQAQPSFEPLLSGHGASPMLVGETNPAAAAEAPTSSGDVWRPGGEASPAESASDLADAGAPGIGAESASLGGPACDLPLVEPGTSEAASIEEEEILEPEAIAPPIPEIIDVTALDWDAIGSAVDPGAIRARMRATVERMEDLLDRPRGPGLLFDQHRANPDDRAIAVATLEEDIPLWFIGDLHGDLLALEAALALIDARAPGDPPSRIVFLGDLIDDGGYGLEVVLRVFELMLEAPERVCLVAGNHDEALQYDGARFSATVMPSDFADFLNERLAHEWIARAGKLAVRLFADVPRALFFPDGLLVSHGGFPLADLHAELRERGDWNDPRCLTDFVWTRAHLKARKKMPNRSTRGSQFGYEDFAAFCALATELGRPVTHMVRGHDHMDERWAIPPAYTTHPILTTNAMSRQLDREPFGPYERVPTVARWVPGAVPQVHRLHVPGALVREVFPQPDIPHGVSE